MKRIWKQLVQRRNQLAVHPFFVWLNSEDVPLEQRFVFTPVMIDFIMGFADMNKWFLSYDVPRNELERGINEHTEEDRTHSRLFYENWYTVELGETAAWAPGKVLWWLFQSAESAVVRRFGMAILDMAVRYPDPVVRFSMMEAIEICGDVFFGNTAPIATALTKKHGVGHVYFGEYHRARETGHLHTNEKAFTRMVLTEAQLRDAAMVVDAIFDRFVGLLDQLVRYSQREVSDAVGHGRDLEDAYLEAMAQPLDRGSRVATPPSNANVVSPSQHSVLKLLHERRDRLSRHPFLRWLREDDGTPATEKFRGFVALWGIDIVGYRDMNELVLRYPTPATTEENWINDWTENLASHGILYLQDWKALGLDELLGWDMGETIAFYFLSEQTEVHRKNMAKVKKFAFAHREPLLRWWLMKALETTGEPLFECTRPIAESIENELGVTLNYWANRHHLAHTNPERRADHDAEFFAHSMTLEERRVVGRMINTVFDNIEEQLTVSHREALSAVFLEKPASVLPLRRSDVVLRAIASEEPARAVAALEKTAS